MVLFDQGPRSQHRSTHTRDRHGPSAWWIRRPASRQPPAQPSHSGTHARTHARRPSAPPPLTLPCLAALPWPPSRRMAWHCVASWHGTLEVIARWAHDTRATRHRRGRRRAGSGGPVDSTRRDWLGMKSRWPLSQPKPRRKVLAVLYPRRGSPGPFVRFVPRNIDLDAAFASSPRGPEPLGSTPPPVQCHCAGLGRASLSTSALGADWALAITLALVLLTAGRSRGRGTAWQLTKRCTRVHSEKDSQTQFRLSTFFWQVYVPAQAEAGRVDICCDRSLSDLSGSIQTVPGDRRDCGSCVAYRSVRTGPVAERPVRWEGGERARKRSLQCTIRPAPRHLIQHR